MTVGKEENEALVKLFKESIGQEKLEVECAKMETTSLPAVINLSEEARRLQEMHMMFPGSMPEVPEEKKLIINLNSPIVEALTKKEDKEFQKLVCNYIFDLAQLAHKPLTSGQMAEFLERSNSILEKVAKA